MSSITWVMSSRKIRRSAVDYYMLLGAVAVMLFCHFRDVKPVHDGTFYEL